MLNPKLRVMVETWLAAEAAVFTLAALVHAGVALPWFREPVILVAAIAEGVCALMLLATAREVSREGWSARRAVLASQGVAGGTVALGMLGLALELAPSTVTSTAYVRGILALLVMAFVLVASPLGAPSRRRAVAMSEPAPRGDWADVSTI